MEFTNVAPGKILRRSFAGTYNGANLSGHPTPRVGAGASLADLDGTSITPRPFLEIRRMCYEYNQPESSWQRINPSTEVVSNPLSGNKAGACEEFQVISEEQVAKYHEAGYLILEGFADERDCDRLRARAEELVREFDPADVVSIFSTHEQNRLTDEYFLTSGDKIRFFFEENAFNPDGTLKYQKEKSINKIGHALHDLDPVFDQFSRGQNVNELAASIGFYNPLLLQSMYIFKQPNIGGEVTCHQDSTFLYTEPTEIAGLWFALEDATIENGCLWAIPGGHQHGLKSRWKRTSNGRMEFETLDSAPWPEDKLVPLEVAKGTLILLHGLLPHRSFENKSSRSRHAYTLHLISANAKYPADNWLQRSETMPLRGFD